VLFDSFVNRAKPDSTECLLSVRGREVPLIIVRNLRARRYLLRLRADGSIRLTIPRRGSIREGRKFAESKTDWLARELEKCAAVTAKSKEWTDGSSILFRGGLVTLETIVLTGSCFIRCGEETIAIPSPTGDLRACVERYLRSLATKELTARTQDLASQHQLTVKRITIRNQRSRWGSCSPRGLISLNWRLIQTPQFVSDYIVLHELMHLRQMNHSSRFWREVERAFPDYMIAERWLGQHSGLLRE
jgi:predicted metal-dependent hydrolase